MCDFYNYLLTATCKWLSAVAPSDICFSWFLQAAFNCTIIIGHRRYENNCHTDLPIIPSSRLNAWRATHYRRKRSKEYNQNLHTYMYTHQVRAHPPHATKAKALRCVPKNGYACLLSLFLSLITSVILILWPLSVGTRVSTKTDRQTDNNYIGLPNALAPLRAAASYHLVFAHPIILVLYCSELVRIVERVRSRWLLKWQCTLNLAVWSDKKGYSILLFSMIIWFMSTFRGRTTRGPFFWSGICSLCCAFHRL